MAEPVLAAAGTLDPSFGGDGLVVTAIPPEAWLSDLALQPDGMIVLTGAAGMPGPTADFVVARYNPDGTLDPGFGDGGIVVTPIGGFHDFASAVAIQEDNRIVAAGRSVINGNFDLALVRYNADGTLDETFGGGDGKVVTDFDSGSDDARALAIQADGRIVVAGHSFNGFDFDFIVARYNPDGSLDTSFGGDGKVTAAIGSENDLAFTMALQSNGKIVLAGWSSNGTDTDFALLRFSSDGALDTTFGGDGKVTTDLGADDSISDIVIQPDGRIAVAGTSNFDLALARYNTDGTLDVAFGGGDGRVTVEEPTGALNPGSIALQPDGKLVVGGQFFSAGEGEHMVARFDPDGSVDDTFGIVVAPSAGDDSLARLVLQPDGGIVLAGSLDRFAEIGLMRLHGGIADHTVVENTEFTFAFAANAFTDPEDGELTYVATLADDTPLPDWLEFDAGSRTFSGAPDEDDVGTIDVKITATDDELLAASDTFSITVESNDPPVLSAFGIRDPAFSGDGLLSTNFNGFHDNAYGAVLQDDGKIVVAGEASVGAGNTLFDFALARYNPDGTLDTLFGGGDGQVTTDFSGGASDSASSVALQEDDGIVVAGASAGDFALARYTTDGGLDSLFGGGDGLVTTDFGSGTDVIRDVALQADGKIVTVGTTGASFESEFALARYNTDGTLDTMFGGGDGMLTTVVGSASSANAVAIQADGKIVVAGWGTEGDRDFALARFNSDGSLDMTFGDGDGTVLTDVGVTSFFDEANGLAIQDDGKIVLAGYSFGSIGGDNFAVARYNADGSLDTSFGGDGIVTTVFTALTDVALAVEIQSDGRIVAVGKSHNGSSDDYAFVRYKSDGSLDSTFSDDGKLTITPSGADIARAVLIQPDGAIVAAGTRLGANNDFAVARLVSGPSLSDQAGTEDQPFNLVLGPGVIEDPDGTLISYNATQADGSALPDWLEFDPDTVTFSGTPTNGDVGVLDVKLIGADATGLEGSDVFRLTVANVNDAPVAGIPIGQQNAEVGTLFGFTVPDDAFVDVDVGDSLTYAATLSNGSPLPGWLGLDSASGAFSGAPPAGEYLKSYDIKVTATDEDGASAFVTFTLSVPTAGAGDDSLTGSAGNDTLDGGIGADTLRGLGGDDVYIVDNGSDRIIEEAGASGGDDEARSSESYVLPDNVEDLVLTGGASINGTGNDLQNLILGNDAANRLDGGGANAIDDLRGGDGNDTYVVDNSNDVVIEVENDGTDTVESTADYVLPENVENLTLTLDADRDGTGNTLANILTGNTGGNELEGLGENDTIFGGDGNDTLDGGAGADSMLGGDGDDAYVVDNEADSVVEDPDQGIDLVLSSVTRTLGANQEKLTLTGGAGINGTGNELDNDLIGNDADNELRGLDGDDALKGADLLDGTTGADTFYGGLGNDLYYVDSADDRVIEEEGEGTADTIYAFTNLTLPDHVERVEIVDANAYALVGNGLANIFRGNVGNDTLDGGGGNDTLEGGGGADELDGEAGADSMSGGTGDDIYYVDNAGDVVFEASNTGGLVLPGGGSGPGLAGSPGDTVKAAVNYALKNFVEHLELTGSASRGTGNSLANNIKGNVGADTLNGAAGNDTLDGGLDNDLLLGRTGKDWLIWGAKDRLDGGKDVDTLRTSVNLDLTKVKNTDIKSVEQIDLSVTGKQKLTLNATDVLDMSEVGNTIKVLGAKGDSVDIVGSFTRGAASGGFRSYKVGSGILQVDTDIIVS